MSKNIANRLEKIEKALSISNIRQNSFVRIIVIISRRDDKTACEQLGSIEQWESYKQVIAQNPDDEIILLTPDPQLELIARNRPLTKNEIAALLRDRPQVA